MTKTILITGATDGIGLMTAQKLAEVGHKVLLHGRSADKLAAAQAQINAPTEAFRADLSTLAEVDAMAEAVRAAHTTLDVLINNAGVLKTPQARTASGRDIRFEVNTIAPYLLTQRLLPLMPKDGRVVNLSSAAQARVDVGAMTQFRPMADMDAYAQSKLAITLWTRVLADARPEGPVFLAVNPGSLLASKMVKEGFGIAGKDLNIGADILVQASLAEAFATRSGSYFDNDSGQFAPPDPAAEDPAQTRDVMAALVDVTGVG